MKKAMITLSGKDRPGIIAGVTEVLYRYHCNLEDITMTLLEGEFTMMMVVSLRAGKEGEIEQALANLIKPWGLHVVCRPIRHRLRRGRQHAQGTTPYLLSAVGRDKTGIVYRTSQALAGLGLNITDLNCKILGYGQKALYAMMLEFDVPKGFSIQRLQSRLKRLRRQLDIDIQLKPLEVVTL